MTSAPDASRQPNVRHCWCGNEDLQSFSEGYQVCEQCGTLVSVYDHCGDVSRVRRDDLDLYGREYWFSHMEQDLGLPNIYDRARSDLAERCLFWLKTVLKYKTPPGRVLELGSAHGAFVAALRWAGFDAVGLELSPSIVSIARDLFDVRLLQGPIEDQNIDGTFHVIVLLDVLEHLPDPVGTLQRCQSLLDPDGFLLIQTPKYPAGKSLSDLVGEKHRFVEMLIPDEHLYLFSDKSVAQLLGRLGFPYVSVEPALFSHYDMFLAVSCVPLSPIDSRSQAESLVQSSHGRLILAALDLFGQMRDAAVQISGLQAEANGLHSEVEALRVAFAASETDRTARLEIIHKQGDELGRIKLVRDELGKEIETLRDALASAESDRAARLEVIQQQGDQLGRVRALEADLRSEVEALRAALTSSEADRAARLAYIEQQGEDLGRLARLEGQLRAEIDELRSALAASESNHLQVVQQLGEEIGCLSAAMADGDFLKKRIRVLAAERRGPNLLTRIVDRFRPNGTNDDPDR